MDPSTSLTICVGIVLFFAGLSSCIWLFGRVDVQKRELEHTERMRGMEVGQRVTFPDSTINSVEDTRVITLGCIGIIVPFAAVAAGVGATALILIFSEEKARLVFISIVWGVVTLVSLVAIGAAWHGLRKVTVKHLKVSSPQGHDGDEVIDSDPSSTSITAIPPRSEST